MTVHAGPSLQDNPVRRHRGRDGNPPGPSKRIGR
jgi:hypothetical protein